MTSQREAGNHEEGRQRPEVVVAYYIHYNAGDDAQRVASDNYLFIIKLFIKKGITSMAPKEPAAVQTEKSKLIVEMLDCMALRGLCPQGPKGFA